MPPSAAELISRRGALGRGLVADRSADDAVAARGLERMQALMDRLGNPQLSYPVVHVAGSKGKGTTTHLAAALLTAHGLRTGRYTSPHLHEWSERIAIDDQAIAEERFALILAEIDDQMCRLEREQPDLGVCSAFELLTAAAFEDFAEQRVDCAVIEVGLGGRFDSTNVVPAVVSVITRIEREHADILGPELSDIAWNKAGILAPKTPVVVTSQNGEALAVIESEAAEKGAALLLEGYAWSMTNDGTDSTYRFSDLSIDELSIGLPGAHNRANAGAALTATAIALGYRPLDPDICRETLAIARIPGRFETHLVGRPPVRWVLDVAHTPESIAALLDTVRAGSPERPPAVLLGLLADKPADEILAELRDRVAIVFLPELRHPRSIPAAELAAIASRLRLPHLETTDLESSITLTYESRQPTVVTGSFTIVARVQELLAARLSVDA